MRTQPVLRTWEFGTCWMRLRSKTREQVVRPDNTSISNAPRSALPYKATGPVLRISKKTDAALQFSAYYQDLATGPQQNKI